MKPNNPKEKLENLVQQAKNSMEVCAGEKDTRAEAALLDMIDKAEKALAGKKFPFTCQREFWKREEDDEINFALQHYTMVPSFFDESRNYGVYGLMEAVKWYRNRSGCRKRNTGIGRLAIHEITEGNFFLSGSEIETLRDKIKKDVSFRKQFEEVKKIADTISLEELRYKYRLNFQNADFTELGEKFNLWRQSGNGANFAVPETAVKAVVSIRLPAEENREEGLGYIRIRNLRLNASGGDVIQVNKGLAESDTIYLENSCKGERAKWESNKFPIAGGMDYSLMFEAKQEGKFKRGVQITIISYDGQNEAVGRYEYFYNKKSWIPVEKYNLSMQCDSIVYMVSGDVSYAEKAKIEMLHMMDDFCQGAYYWMTYNERPEGLDCYGAVQAGRNLCSLAVTYALTEKAQIFSADEKSLFYELADFLVHYCLDLRDRTQMGYEEAQKGSSNWQTDMCIGVSFMMFALNDFPNREMWVENAYAVLYGQLITNLNPDGSWPESIRYHHAALEKFASYARVLKRMTGIDWFRDTRLPDMFAYGIEIQTPAYAYFDNCISTPPFGDHTLSAGEEFAIYGLYLREAADKDPALADKMYLTWMAGGGKRKKLWGESIAVENFLYPSDYKLQTLHELRLKSTDKYKDAGVYIFRNIGSGGKTDYLAVMASRKKIGHGHLDQGSFILYKDNIPIVMDSGIEGYFDVSTPWHISSYSHACMLFGTERIEKEMNPGFINLSAGNFTREHGYWDTPDSSRVISSSIGEGIESLEMMIACRSGRGKHIRRFESDSHRRIWKIQDWVEEYEGEILFSLPLAARKVEVAGNQIHVEGYYGVGLDIKVMSTCKTITVEKGRTAPVCPAGKGQQYLKYLRIRADAGDGFEIEMQ